MRLHFVLKNISAATFTFISMLQLVSCAPKLQEKKRRPETLAQGARFQDIDLARFSKDPFAEKDFSEMHLSQPLSQIEQLQQIEAEFTIGQIPGLSFWKSIGLKSFENFSKDQSFKSLKSEDSVYLDLVDQQINPSVDSSVAMANQKLKKDVETVARLVRALKDKYLVLTPVSTFYDKLQAAKSFIQKVSATVTDADIMPEFKKLLVKNLSEKSKTLLNRAQLLDSQTQNAKCLSEMMTDIDSYILESKTVLSDVESANLTFGRKLGSMVDGIDDPKNALQALAFVWSILTDPQRIEFIESTNKNLYDFLNSKDAEGIQCLISSDCNGIITTVSLNIGVYPAIKSYGVIALKNMLNQKGMAFVLQSLNEASLVALQAVGEQIISEVTDSVDGKRADLNQFNKNLNSVLKNNWDTYLAHQGIEHVHGFILNSKNEISSFESQNILIRNKLNRLNELSADSNHEILRTQFEVIEQTLRLPKFSQSPVAETGTSELSQSDLVQLILHPKAREFTKNSGQLRHDLNVGLNEQSQLLLTTSKLIRNLADWKVSSFDQNLSAIKANEIITEFKSAELNRSFFAKPDLLALILSVASETLKLLEDKNSPVVLIDNNQKIVLIQKFQEGQSQPLALAAATSFVNGQLSSVIQAFDLAQLQLALIEFYSATAGLEKTTSVVLRQKEAQGLALLDQVLEARKKIKGLIVAIGNFISNQMMQKNGLVTSNFELETNRVSGNFKLLDQVASIEALVRTYEVTDIDVYLWSAQDIYFSMNHNLYNPEIKFYNPQYLEDKSETNPSLDTLVLLQTYRSLTHLQPYLSSESQSQMDLIFTGWLESFN